MDRKQAIEYMKMGLKLTHRFFTPNEWVSLNRSGQIVTEEGLLIHSEEFWSVRESSLWNKDWSVWNG